MQFVMTVFCHRFDLRDLLSSFWVSIFNHTHVGSHCTKWCQMLLHYCITAILKIKGRNILLWITKVTTVHIELKGKILYVLCYISVVYAVCTSLLSCQPRIQSCFKISLCFHDNALLYQSTLVCKWESGSAELVHGFNNSSLWITHETVHLRVNTQLFQFSDVLLKLESVWRLGDRWR